MLRWRTEEHGDSEQITPFGAHRGRAWPPTPQPEFAILRQGSGTWDLGSLIEGLARGHGAGPAPARPGRCYRLAVVLTLAAAPSARSLAAARGVRPARRRRELHRTGLHGQAQCAADQDAVETAGARAMVRTDTKPCWSLRPGRRWPPGAWPFSRRLSAAVRRRRTGSTLAVSVVPRSRTAPHSHARIAMVATAARCRRRRRWPAVCRRG
jgi:hypothetical protein